MGVLWTGGDVGHRESAKLPSGDTAEEAPRVCRLDVKGHEARAAKLTPHLHAVRGAERLGRNDSGLHHRSSRRAYSGVGPPDRVGARHVRTRALLVKKCAASAKPAGIPRAGVHAASTSGARPANRWGPVGGTPGARRPGRAAHARTSPRRRPHRHTPASPVHARLLALPP